MQKLTERGRYTPVSGAGTLRQVAAGRYSLRDIVKMCEKMSATFRSQEDRSKGCKICKERTKVHLGWWSVPSGVLNFFGPLFLGSANLFFGCGVPFTGVQFRSIGFNI